MMSLDDNSHPPRQQELAVDPMQQIIQRQDQDIRELKEKLDKKEAQMSEALEKKEAQMKEIVERKDREMEDKLAKKDEAMKKELEKKDEAMKEELEKKEEAMKEELEKKEKRLASAEGKLEKAQEKAENLGKGNERYYAASVCLSLFVIVCIGVAASRQLELNSWAAQYSSCSLEVKELTKIAGEWGKNQLEELESCRKELYNLREEKGKCIVYEAQIKGNTSLATAKNAEFLMREMQDYRNQAAANAERKYSCVKHLRHVEGTMHQLLQNLTVVIAENERCKMSLIKCIDNQNHEGMTTKTVPSPKPTGEG